MSEQDNYKNVGRKLIRAGLPKLGEGLLRVAGMLIKNHPVGGVLDDIGVLDSIGEALGVEPNIKSVEKAIDGMSEAELASFAELKRAEADVTIAEIERGGIESQEVTKRHATDSNSDSWLAKNIRPISLGVLGSTYLIYIFATVFFLDIEKAEIAKGFGLQLTGLLTTVFAFYFGGRSYEKSRR